MHCIYALYVFYALYSYPEGVELTLKLVGDGPTDRPTNRPTDRPTDIVLYRAAIAAKKLRRNCTCGTERIGGQDLNKHLKIKSLLR